MVGLHILTCADGDDVFKRIVGVGIIGTGGISEAHAQGYLSVRKKARIVAVSDIDKRRAKKKAARWGAESWYLNFEELLKRDDIEAVSVCTPTFTHAQISVAAMKSGKHVLCEKPMAMNLEEADEMIETSEQEKVILQIGHHNRFEPVFERTKELIEEGIVGRICQVKARQAHGWGWTKGMPRSWFAEPDKSGGGTLLDNGCHLFDLLRWLVGEVETVSAYVGTLVYDIPVEDNGIAILQFKNGAMGEVDASWTYRGDLFENYIRIFGSEGTIIADPVSKKLVVYSGFLKPKKMSGWIAPFIPSVNAHTREVQDFISCMTEGKKPRVSGDDGKKSLELALAAYMSSRKGQRVTLPLTYEE